MKTFLITIAFFATTLLSAQTLKQDDLKNALASDDTVAFKKLITKDTKNACLSLGNSSYNLLALTIKTGATNCFNSLLEQKPNLEKACANKTPLMYAVKYGELNMVKALIKAGANPKTTTSSGRTALDYAKKYKKEEIATYLESL